MRVTMPTIFANIQNNLLKLASDLHKTKASISSGKKYQSISEDPATISQMLGLAKDSRQVTQYQRNLETAQQWLSATESALGSINQVVQGVIGLANQMATGSYTASQRQNAALQVQGWLAEVMQAGNQQYDGHYLLSGYRVDTQPFAEGDWQVQSPIMRLQSGSTGQATAGGVYTGSTSRSYVVEIVTGGATGVATFRVSQDGGQTWGAEQVTGAAVPVGAEGVVATFQNTWVSGDRFIIPVYKPINYQGDNNTLEISIGQQGRLAVNEVGSQAVGGEGGQNDLFQILARLKSSLEANDLPGVAEGLEGLTAYQGNLSGLLGGLGASQNRVTTKNQIYDQLTEQLAGDLSKKGDTDLVEAVTALKIKQNAYQAALQASTMVMDMSLLDYL